jgi:hypothetical protein
MPIDTPHVLCQVQSYRYHSWQAVSEDGAISGILNIIHDLIAIIFMSGNFYVRPSPHFFKGCGKQI